MRKRYHPHPRPEKAACKEDLLIKYCHLTVLRQSQVLPALGQVQGRPQAATRQPQARARPTPHTKDRLGRQHKAEQNVKTTHTRHPSPITPPFPPPHYHILTSHHNPPYTPLHITPTQFKKAQMCHVDLYRNVLTPFPRSSHDIRKSIARVLTIINATQRQQLRLFYKGKKYLPLDLRAKKTRALRRKLTKHESQLVTEKTRKRLSHFPQRRFAVRA